MEYPKLYFTDESGNERMWSVSVKGNVKYTTSGRVDGKKMINERKYEGKNIGKSNETTSHEQAVIGANLDWVRMNIR